MNVFKTRAGPGAGPERILVGMSNGSSSRLLLYFTQLSKIQDPNRRNMDLFFPVHIIEDEAEDTAELEKYIAELGLEYRGIPLHAVFDSESVGNSESKAALKNAMESAKNETMKYDLVRLMRRLLLTRIASKLDCKRIYVGETNDRMAINVMADVCAGRGATVPWSQLPVQPLGSTGISIVRPLREAQALEIPRFLELIGKSVDSRPAPNKQTIYGLTDSFMSGLALDFSATPSIVTRTAAKVQTEKTPLESMVACKLCFCPLHQSSEMLCQPCIDIFREVPALQIDELSL